MSHFDTFGVACRSGCVVKHVDVVPFHKLRVQHLAGLAACLTHLVQREHSNLVIVLGTLLKCHGFFVGIKHNNVFDERCVALVPHAEHLLEVRSRHKHRL